MAQAHFPPSPWLSLIFGGAALLVSLHHGLPEILHQFEGCPSRQMLRCYTQMDTVVVLGIYMWSIILLVSIASFLYGAWMIINRNRDDGRNG